MKIAILTAILTAGAMSAASITVNPVALAHGVRAGLTQHRGLHRVVFGAELIGAAISVGADLGSTEYALAHSGLWEASCACYVKVAHESDPLFLRRGTNNLDQEKIFGWKIGLAVGPFLLSYGSHKLMPESTWVDASLIGLIGVGDFWYGKAAINNIHIANRIIAENHAAGH